MNKWKTRRVTETPAVAHECGKEHRRLFVLYAGEHRVGQGATECNVLQS